jgi:hypothetical protein
MSEMPSSTSDLAALRLQTNVPTKRADSRPEEEEVLEEEEVQVGDLDKKGVNGSTNAAMPHAGEMERRGEEKVGLDKRRGRQERSVC